MSVTKSVGSRPRNGDRIYVSLPYGLTNITGGPDGNVWFTSYNGTIGQITPAGVVTEFTTGLPYGLSGITAGPDGNLWFTTQYNGIGRIRRLAWSFFTLPVSPAMASIPSPPGLTATCGSPKRHLPDRRASRPPEPYQFPPINGGANDITAGPDGNLWITENYGNRIGRVALDASAVEFSSGITATSQPTGITLGSDGICGSPNRPPTHGPDYSRGSGHGVQHRHYRRQPTDKALSLARTATSGSRRRPATASVASPRREW